jgi:hypothetical protein
MSVPVEDKSEDELNSDKELNSEESSSELEQEELFAYRPGPDNMLPEDTSFDTDNDCFFS